MYISYSDSVEVLLLTSNNGSVLSEINQREEKNQESSYISTLLLLYSVA